MLAPLEYRLWADRDLVRAAHLLDELPTAGAELSYGSGARIPGGFGHVVLAAAQAVHDDPVGVQRFLYLLDTVGLALVAAVAWRRLGPLAAALTAAVWMGTAVVEEGLAQLWNPAYLPLFVAGSVVGLHRFVITRRARWLALWGAGVALAAHMHLSAVVWAGAGAAALLFSEDRRNLARGLGAALAAAALTYAPHLLDEVLRGFPNTRELLAQPHVRAVTESPARTWRLGDLPVVLDYLAGHAPAAAVPAWLAPVRWATLGGFAAGLIGAWVRVRRGDADARGLLLVGAASGLAAAWLLLDPLIATQGRYFYVVVPGLSLTAGVGLASLARSAGRLGPGAAVLAQAGVALAVALPASWWVDAGEPGLGGKWSHDLRMYARVTEETGWRGAELVGRTVVAVAGPRGPTWTLKAADDLLRRRGEAFDGSRPPPCGLVLAGIRAGEVDEELVGGLVHVPEGRALAVERVVALTPGSALVVYDPGAALCPTSIVQRYVDRPAEAAARAMLPRLRDGQAARLPDPAPRTARFVAVVQADPTWDGARLAATVDLRHDGRRLHATLESNQLRGEALNLGWFLPALVDRPRLRLEPVGGGPADEVVWVDGLLGYRAAVTPVRAEATLQGAGPWRVTLVLDRAHRVERMPWPPQALETTPVEVVLAERWPDAAVVAR